MKKFLIGQFEFLLAALLVVVDLVFKAFFDGKEFAIISGVFIIKSAHNTGAAFSFLTGKTALLTVISVVFLVGFLLFHASQKQKTWLYRFGFSLFLAGAVGNMVDRIFLGHVRDFLFFELINFPIFNVADICLNVGAALLILFFIKTEIATLKQNKESQKKVSND